MSARKPKPEPLTEERIRQIIREEIQQNEADKDRLARIAERAQSEVKGVRMLYGAPFLRRGGSNV